MNNEAKPRIRKSKGVAPRKAIGVNIKESDAKILEEKLTSIGLKTTGDLVLLFVREEGASDALRPFAEKYMGYLNKDEEEKQKRLEKRLRVLREMSPERFKELIEKIEE